MPKYDQTELSMPSTATKTQYVVVWADGHHPVRVLNLALRAGEAEPLNGQTVAPLNEYCRFLQRIFPGTRMEWQPVAETSVPASIRSSDTMEFHTWREECYEL